MFIEDADLDTYARRVHTYNIAKIDYIIYTDKSGTHWYSKDGQLSNKVSINSAIRVYKDFEYCEQYGNLLQQPETTNIKQENKMKDVNYIGGQYKVVCCTYNLVEVTGYTDLYNFKIDIDKVVEEGSIVVVESTRGLGLCKVVEVLDNCIENAEKVGKATAWVVDVVSTTAHEEKKEATKRRDYILTQLEEKKKSMEVFAMYDMLSKYDTEAAKLVAELKQLCS